jgi:hypothetical protein
VLLWGHTELIVKCVMPDLFHVVPIGDDTVLNGIFKGEDTSLGLGFVTGESIGFNIDRKFKCSYPT